MNYVLKNSKKAQKYLLEIGYVFRGANLHSTAKYITFSDILFKTDLAEGNKYIYFTDCAKDCQKVKFKKLKSIFNHHLKVCEVERLCEELTTAIDALSKD